MLVSKRCLIRFEKNCFNVKHLEKTNKILNMKFEGFIDKLENQLLQNIDIKQITK